MTKQQAFIDAAVRAADDGGRFDPTPIAARLQLTDAELTDFANRLQSAGQLIAPYADPATGKHEWQLIGDARETADVVRAERAKSAATAAAKPKSILYGKGEARKPLLDRTPIDRKPITRKGE